MEFWRNTTIKFLLDTRYTESYVLKAIDWARRSLRRRKVHHCVRAYGSAVSLHSLSVGSDHAFRRRAARALADGPHLARHAGLARCQPRFHPCVLDWRARRSLHDQALWKISA